jgi:hypothetical protein
MTHPYNRRTFIEHAAAVGGALGLGGSLAAAAEKRPEESKPLGEAKGIHPGRVVWVHDPKVLDWKGPGDGRWYEGDRTKQYRFDGMMAEAVCRVTGQETIAKAWDRLFRHFNQSHGQGDAGYKPGQKILIKPNWVGMIWREGAVNPATYTLVQRQDYMNTSPQMIIALMRQLVSCGVRESDITVCDSLAYLVHEYYNILHKAFPKAQYVDFAGKFGRTKVQESKTPLFWSCRPKEVLQDFLPTCITEAAYLVNFATFKAHTATGVTLCGKNHFGSLVRWPVQEKYYDMHRASFQTKTGIYREQVDLLGHAELGGKTVLNLIDGLFTGKHPIDPAPRRAATSPFDGQWPMSLFASQDPVAVDSVAFDFLHAEFDDFPRRPGTDDYLHEAALAANPPSGTFYDPDHAEPTRRLASLGVHEHWNNPQDKKYSRNLRTGEGIELVAVKAE